MSEIEYVEIPLETDPEELSQESFDYLQSKIAGWVPNDANLETVFVEALARLTAEARDVASAAPTDIFRYFGSLVGVNPQEATFATAKVTFTAIDNAGYVIPAGTQVGIRLSGDDLVPFETTDENLIPTGSLTVTGCDIVALDSGSAPNGLSQTLPCEMIDSLAFVSVVDTTTDTGGGSEEETTTEYLNRLSARLTLLADRPILPNDFAILATDIPGVERATAIDLYNPDHNLLTVNTSSLETDTTGWIAQTNCTISRDTSQHSDGGASLKLVATAGGAMSAITNPTTTYAVTPLQHFAALAEFKAGTTGRNCRVNLAWYNSSSILISTTNGSSFADNSTGFVQAFVADNAPATAAYVRVVVEVLAAGAGLETHYVDKIALKHYDGRGWSIGGTSEFNNERMVTVFPVDSLGQPLSTTVKNQVDAYLQSLREVSFIVNVADPMYTTVDVTFAAKAFPNFDVTDVETAAEQAVRDYLSPKNWGLSSGQGVASTTSGNPKWVNTTSLRYLELTTVVNNVPGVDYVQSLTFGRPGALGTTDITLDGPAPLPTPGTINGTVS